MKIETKTSFEKMFAKLQKRDKEAVGRAIDKFIQNPFDVTLRNHRLKGVYCGILGLSSINAGGDLRILFKELSDGRYEVVCLMYVGSHSQLY